MRASLGHPPPFDNQKFVGFAHVWDSRIGLKWLKSEGFDRALYGMGCHESGHLNEFGAAFGMPFCPLTQDSG